MTIAKHVDLDDKQPAREIAWHLQDVVPPSDGTLVYPHD